MNGIYRFFMGFWQVQFVSSSPERILNFLRQEGIPFWGVQRNDEGFSFLISLRDEGVLSRLVLGEGEALRKERGGFPAILFLFRRRIAFFGGILFLIMVLFLSREFVWSVDITGNETVPDEVIREAFAQLGLKAGAQKKKLDQGELSLLFQVKHPEFSYASVNFIGTRAKVEVREGEAPIELQKEEGCQNLVASKAARILRFEVTAGQIQVTAGETVSAGTLLVSGITESKKGTYSMVCARGKVFGETETVFEVTIPLEEKKEVLTGTETHRKTATVLGFTFPLTPFFSEPDTAHRVLVKEEPLTLFGWQLPIIIKEETFVETTVKTIPLTVDRARDLAYDKYNEYKRERVYPDGEILEEEILFTEEEHALRMTVKLSAIENIAEAKPVKMTDIPS